MHIDAIDHIYVETADYDAARAFWTQLGFSAESEWGDGDHRAGKFVCGTAAVVLATAHGTAKPCGPTVHLHVEQTAQAQKALDAADGIRVLVRDEPTHWGTRWIRVADPDGNEWVLEQTSPE